jgi:putative phosphoesterase
MKILCVSDTHLENTVFEEITNRYPDMDYYIHCGDSSLTKEDPLLKKYYVVKGNHDVEDFPLEISLFIENHYCLIVHGNNHDMYKGNQTLLTYMKENKYDICFHGHTHIPSAIFEEDCWIINPGSVMINRASYGFGTYAIITLEQEQLQVAFYHHRTHQECTKGVLKDGKETLKRIRELL